MMFFLLCWLLSEDQSFFERHFKIILLLQVSALKQGFVPITPEGIAVSISAKSVYDIKICFIFLLVTSLFVINNFLKNYFLLKISAFFAPKKCQFKLKFACFELEKRVNY